MDTDETLTLEETDDNTSALPVPDHNQPSARALVYQMRHAAHEFVANEHASETHMLSVMECAYRLRLYREESPEHRDEVEGVLGKEKIADTTRTPPFTRLLKYAFHKDEVEKSRISRCAAALQHAWMQQPERIAADDLSQFIAGQGGIVKCAEKLKTSEGMTTKVSGEPISLSCVDATALLGHTSVAGTLRQTDAGVVFVPSKVLSPVRERGDADASGNATRLADVPR